MKTMICSDFLSMRSTLIQLSLIVAVIVLVMAFVTDSLVASTAAIVAMAPFMFLFSVAALDEQNGWERFRLTLPLSRRQVILGRYASVLLATVATVAGVLIFVFVIGGVAQLISGGDPSSPLACASYDSNPPTVILGSAVMAALVILVGCSVALPLVARFGVTKASRFVPLAVVLMLAFGVGFCGEYFTSVDFSELLENAGTVAFVAVATVVVLAVYALSALLAAKLYEQREL